LLHSSPCVDEVITMVDQQLQIAKQLLVEPWPAQLRLAQRGSCDRERVDRVRLPTCATGPSLWHGQPRRHPHQLLTRGE
jgi:hypothetical protein